MARVSIAEAVRTWRIRPFEYGSSDCCAFCNHVVEAMTGKSYLPEYTDHESLLKRYGGLSGAVTRYVGTPTSDLRPGDLALVSVLEQESLGVVVDESHVITMFEDGMPRFLSRAFVDHGWSV